MTSLSTPRPDRAPQREHALADGVGVGLKAQHVRDILAGDPLLGFVEIHAENYMGAGGPPHRHLAAIRERLPLSVHGVGLSLGGAQRPDPEHLARLKALVRRYDPALVSEHLAWSSHGGAYLNDLLPLPYTRATLELVAAHVDEVQSALGRRILLENPSTYLAFTDSEIEEAAFIAEIARRTGCGLLLDVNNLYVSAINAGRDPLVSLAAFPTAHVAQIHLAGHAARHDARGRPLLVDSHDRPIAEPVWALYREALGRTGPLPTLIERDADIPPWETLRAEVQRAHDGLCAASMGGAFAVAG